MGWMEWLADYEKTAPISLVIFFVVFCLILFYLFSDRERGERLESYKNIPLMDDQDIEEIEQ